MLTGEIVDAKRITNKAHYSDIRPDEEGPAQRVVIGGSREGSKGPSGSIFDLRSDNEQEKGGSYYKAQQDDAAQKRKSK